MNRLSAIAATMTILSGLIGVQAQAGLISEKSELQMGRDAAKQIEQKYHVSTDKQLTARVETIGKRVAAKSSRSGLAWVFKVLDTTDVNAFSVPGYVYVNKGLMDYIGSDTDALAGVIAHEVGHTTARHAVKATEKQLTFGLLIQLLAKKGNAQQLGGVAANLALLGYSRKDEYQADLLAVQYSHSAGYDPNGMIRFFRKLQAKEGNNSGGLSIYFKTHPPTADRIKRVSAEMTRLGLHPDQAASTKPQPSRTLVLGIAQG